jgi:NitT/TauT family transport system permease protein
MKINIFSTVEGKKRFGWADIFVIILIFSVLFAAVKLGEGMFFRNATAGN